MSTAQARPTSVTTASREEYLGHALEAEIRSRVRAGREYRLHRPHWSGYERDNELALRLLFSIRRDGLRMRAAERDRVDAAWRQALAGLGMRVAAMGELEQRAAWGDK